MLPGVCVGTTNRVNGISIQKAFIGSKIPRPVVSIPKNNQRTISAQPIELSINNTASDRSLNLFYYQHMS